MRFWDVIKADKAFMGIEGTSFVAFFMRLDFMAVFLFRLSAHFARKGKLSRFLGFLFWRLNVLLSGCDIRPHAQIGPGFSVPHPVGVVIGPIKAGRNLRVHQHVTLGRGQATESEDAIRPTLGNNVTLYAGAVVTGAVTLGDHVIVGANAVVLKDVPPSHKALGVPAKCYPIQ